MAEAIDNFDLNLIFLIQIPYNGNMEYVERILNEQGKVLWQVHRCNVTFRDNIPVILSYDINAPTPLMTTPSIQEEYMYLVPIGDIGRTDNTLYNFSSANYARTPIYIDWLTTNSFELNLKIKTGNNVNSRQEIFSMTNTESIELEILSGKFHWELTGTYGKTSLLVNQTYFIRLVKNNTSLKVYISTDGLNYSLDIDSSANFNVKNEWMHFGVDKVCGGSVIEPFLGTMYLNQSTFKYGNVNYKIRITDEEYLNLIRDGNIQVNDQVISNFTSTAYAHTPFYINWSTQNETTILMKIKTGTDITTRQELFGMQSTDNFELEIYNGKLHWELADAWSENYLHANTDYVIEFKKNKTKYEVSATLVSGKVAAYVSATSNRECSNQYLYLGVDKQNSGIEAFKGTIDCKESYLTYNNKKYKFRI